MPFQLKREHWQLWICARNIQRATWVSHPAPLISAQMSRHSCFFSNQFQAGDQAPALIWTLAYLFWTFAKPDGFQMEICLTFYRLWRGKRPDLNVQSKVAYVWKDYIAHFARWLRWEFGAFYGSPHSLSLQPLRIHTSDFWRRRLNRTTLCKLKETTKKIY